MNENVKEKIIEKVAKELGMTKKMVKKIVNHQFTSIKIFVSLNETGEIHIPRLGRIESNEGRVKYVKKGWEKAKEKKEKEKQKDESRN